MRSAAMHHRRIRAFTLIELLMGMIISTLIIGATYAAYLAAHDSWERCGVYKEQHQLARAALSFIERHLRAALPPDGAARIVFEGKDGSLSEDEDFSETASSTSATERSGSSEATSEFSLPPAAGRQDADYLRFASVGGRPSTGSRVRTDLCELEFYLEQPPADEDAGASGGTAVKGANATAEASPEIILSSLMVRRKNLPTATSSLEIADEVEIEEAEVEELVPNVASFNVAYFDGVEWVEDWLFKQSLPKAVEITLIQAEPSAPERMVSFSRLIVIVTNPD